MVVSYMLRLGDDTPERSGDWRRPLDPDLDYFDYLDFLEPSREREPFLLLLSMKRLI